MGSLIPTTQDDLICQALNDRFSEAIDPQCDPANPTKTMIGSVRWHNSNHEHLFDDRGLHRVAWRLINDTPPDPDSRKRWYFLLRHPSSPDALSATNRRDIKAALNVAMTDATIRQVKFQAVHVGGIVPRFEVVTFTSDEISTADKKTKIKTLTIVLQCKLDKQIPAAPGEHDPPHADVVERPPVRIP
jgi:hypothetical protein